jgi:hypothetical protein
MKDVRFELDFLVELFQIITLMSLFRHHDKTFD